MHGAKLSVSHHLWGDRRSLVSELAWRGILEGTASRAQTRGPHASARSIDRRRRVRDRGSRDRGSRIRVRCPEWRFETPRRARARRGTNLNRPRRLPAPKPKPKPNRNPNVRLRPRAARDGWIFVRRRRRARLSVSRTRRSRVRRRPSRVVSPANPRGRRLFLHPCFPGSGSDRVPRGTPGSGSSPRPARG